MTSDHTMSHPGAGGLHISGDHIMVTIDNGISDIILQCQHCVIIKHNINFYTLDSTTALDTAAQMQKSISDL